MGVMASQISSLTIVYSTVSTGADQRKHQSSLRVTGLCAGNSAVTGEFPAQMASTAEDVSIWWRHHERYRIQCVELETGNISTWVFAAHHMLVIIDHIACSSLNGCDTPRAQQVWQGLLSIIYVIYHQGNSYSSESNYYRLQMYWIFHSSMLK